MMIEPRAAKESAELTGGIGVVDGAPAPNVSAIKVADPHVCHDEAVICGNIFNISPPESLVTLMRA